MQQHGLRPRARQEGLVVQELPDELLIYDRETDTAHCLGAVAARVWRSCTGEHDIATLTVLSTDDGDAEALVGDALDELYAKGLLVEAPASEPDAPRTVSRRQAMARMAGVAATPLIVSAMAPAAYASASCVPANTNCSPTGQPCCGNLICLSVTLNPPVSLCLAVNIPGGGRASSMPSALRGTASVITPARTDRLDRLGSSKVILPR